MPKQNKDKLLQVRVTEREWEVIAQAADEVEESISSVARMLILTGLDAVALSDALHEAISA
jgi:hypothetical protein